MKKQPREHRTKMRPFPFASLLFPMCVGALYLILWRSVPEIALHALDAAGHVMLQVSGSLLVAFFLLFLVNLFITPVHVTHFMGRKAGALGLLFSSIAGIVSMGPVYAWYPFLSSLREKGASDFFLANFLSSRTVKPVLIPVMITTFGWRFSLVFSLAGVCSAILTAGLVHFLNRSASRKHIPHIP